jgi:hypothetical protein
MTPEEIMQQIQFFNKYSRFLYEKGRRETWGQTVSRTVEFLKKQAGEALDDDTMNAIFMSIFNQEISPSMRLMATAGKSADTNSNCARMRSLSPVAGGMRAIAGRVASHRPGACSAGDRGGRSRPAAPPPSPEKGYSTFLQLASGLKALILSALFSVPLPRSF